MDDDEDYLLFTAIANWFTGGGGRSWSDRGRGHSTTNGEAATATSEAVSSPPTQRVIMVLLMLLLLYHFTAASNTNFRTF